MAKGSAYSVRRNDEMRRLYERGASPKEIADEFGLAPSGVRQILRRTGVKIRFSRAPEGVNRPGADASHPEGACARREVAGHRRPLRHLQAARALDHRSHPGGV